MAAANSILLAVLLLGCCFSSSRVVGEVVSFKHPSRLRATMRKNNDNQKRNTPSRSLQTSRMLGVRQVEVYSYTDDGTCQLRNSLDTLYTGGGVAYGVYFAVQAVSQSLEIEGFQLANVASNSEPDVSIYYREGTSFSTNSADWTQVVSSVTTVTSPDGLGVIVPRVNMSQSISLDVGQEILLYITFDSAHLIVDETSSTSTGDTYQEDDFLQIAVGEAIHGTTFRSTRSANQAFQGKIHYRVLTPCSGLITQTKLSFPFAAEPGTEPRDLNTAVSDGFDNLLTEEADLARYKEVHGLTINGITLKTKGTLSDCSQYGFSSGCELYDTDLTLRHYESLGERELVLEFMEKLSLYDALGNLDSDFHIVYIGDEILQQAYTVVLTGVPLGTILNPIQRSYLESVTFDFLDEFSSATPYRVEISQVADGASRLRSRRRATQSQDFLQYHDPFDHRSLAGNGIILTETIIYGIGSDLSAFKSDIDPALLSNTNQYKEEIQKQQYLPGEVNDEVDFGALFSDISGTVVSVESDGDDDSTSSSGGGSDDSMYVLIFSASAGLSTLWLLYRFFKDCIWVKDGFDLKQVKLSESMDGPGSFHSRPELENMDKPRQKLSRESVDAMGITTLKGIDDPEGTPIRGRAAPASRGISQTKSSGDCDFFNQVRARGNSREPERRGVERAKSSDFSSFSEHAKPKSFAGMPMRRGQDDDSIPGHPRSQMVSSEHGGRGRAPPAQRGVFASKSAEGLASFLGKATNGRVNAPLSGARSVQSADMGPQRGTLSRTRSADGTLLRNSPPLRPSSVSELRGRRPQLSNLDDSLPHPRSMADMPRRGVGRTRSADGLAAFMGGPSMASNHSRDGSVRSARTAPVSRGVQKSNTFNGVEQFRNNGRRPSIGNSQDGPLRRANFSQDDLVTANKNGKKKGGNGSVTKKLKGKKPKKTKSMPSTGSTTSSISTNSEKTKTKKKGIGKKGTAKPKKAKSDVVGVSRGRPPRPTRVDMTGAAS